MNICPVCGFRGLAAPPTDFIICPCCGTEFGYDDNNRSHDELRQAWLRDGARWFSEYTGPPRGWNPYGQLLRAGMAHRVGTGLAHRVGAPRDVTTTKAPRLPGRFVRAELKYA